MTEKNKELEKIISKRKNTELEDIYFKVKNMRKLYFKNLLKKKKINKGIELIISISSAISTTNIIISISMINPITLIIGGVFSAISTILKFVKTALKLQEEQEKVHITYCNLSDLERDIIHNIDKNDHDFIINVNHRISLIENNAIVISLNSK